jgi:hypothetical protein
MSVKGGADLQIGRINTTFAERMDLRAPGRRGKHMSIEISGPWNKGLAFALHTTSSTYLGVDEAGHDRFENVRSEMGELVYRLKYQTDRAALPEIVALLDGIGGLETFDMMLPIPPTDRSRRFQPVTEITAALGAKRDVPVRTDIPPHVRPVRFRHQEGVESGNEARIRQGRRRPERLDRICRGRYVARPKGNSGLAFPPSARRTASRGAAGLFWASCRSPRFPADGMVTRTRKS